MSRRALALPTVLLAVAMLGAGCGSATRQAGALTRPFLPPSLNTSLVTSTSTWAVAVMGGSAASHNNFWQLFVRPPGTGRWRLATPPGVASNGGLVIASPAAGPVVAGFRPSQQLAYSPLAKTRDNGTSWTPSLLDVALANVPDALAASGTRLFALLADGSAELSGPGGTGWIRLATRRSLRAPVAGRPCGPGQLTAAAFSMSGVPLLAARCARPGSVGIFAYSDRTWHSAGPALPASYARQNITVLRLATTGGTMTAVLAAGAGAAARVITARTNGGENWHLSQPLPLHGATLLSASPGPGGAAVVLSNGHADTITSSTGSWQELPRPPPGTATLAPGPAGGWDALAVHRTRLTIWRLAPGAAAWAAAQTINVPIQFGSSG
jgi:hypothetical protein